MKKILLLLLCFIWTGLIMANPIDMDKAARNAMSFVHSKFNNIATENLSLAAKSASREEFKNDAYYYIFNIGDNHGFVIVSGDDRTNQILGYSDKGSFDAGKMPANMKAMLDNYEKELKTIEKCTDVQAMKILKRSSSQSQVRNSVSPLLTTTWDQATPYWNKCPMFMSGDGTGDLAFTGCVATSMSQIMKYYNFPDTIAKPIPSYTVSYPLEDMSYATFQTDELKPIHFDWKHMKDSYSGKEDSVYTNAVANLMLYAGCAVKMQYTTIASSAKDEDIPVALTKYFSYDKSVKLVYRSDYTQSDWDDMIYKEVSEGRPMIYNGRAVSSGHSFVCDGYEYGDYFHINWGWSGLGNGFFLLSILNPMSSGIGGASGSEGYCMDQTAIIGIKPGIPGSTTEDPVVKQCLSVVGLSINGSQYDRYDNGSFRINGKHQVKISTEDHSGSGMAYKQGLALYDGKQYTMLVESFIASTARTNVFPTNTTSSSYFEFGKGIKEGNYKIVPMCQLKGTTEWMPDLESDRYYLEADISGDNLTIVTHPIITLSVDSFNYAGGEKVGSAEQILATVKNKSVDRFYGNLYLHVGSEQYDEYSNFTSAVQADIPAGETKTVIFNYKPSKDGSQSVYITTDEYGEKILHADSSIVIAPTVVTPMNLNVVINAVNAVDSVIYDNAVRFRVDVTNNGSGEYNQYVLAPLFIVNRDAAGAIVSSAMVTYKQEGLHIGAGETKTLYFDFDNLGFGCTYSLNVYARNENDKLVNLVNHGNSKLYVIRQGLVTWTIDGVRSSSPVTSKTNIPEDAAAVSLEGLSLSSVVPNSNPNCLYYIDSDSDVPSDFQGLNVIKGGIADKISLKDSNGYFCPRRFTASEINYERIFKLGRDSRTKNGWSTLVLPFAPSSVMNVTDSKPIDWYHDTKEAGKNFWIGKFVLADVSELSFIHADSLLANVPYIVAVPDNSWGKTLADLRGKKIVFSARNAELRPNTIMISNTNNFLYIGSYIRQSVENAFMLNEEGSAFTIGGALDVDAFHAYVNCLDLKNLSSLTNLAISFPDDNSATDIQSVMMNRIEDGCIYTLDGRKIGNASMFKTLPHGIYMMNNRKIVR